MKTILQTICKTILISIVLQNCTPVTSLQSGRTLGKDNTEVGVNVSYTKNRLGTFFVSSDFFQIKSLFFH